jgi:hypothetical protein
VGSLSHYNRSDWLPVFGLSGEQKELLLCGQWYFNCKVHYLRGHSIATGSKETMFEVDELEVFKV